MRSSAIGRGWIRNTSDHAFQLVGILIGAYLVLAGFVYLTTTSSDLALPLILAGACTIASCVVATVHGVLLRRRQVQLLNDWRAALNTASEREAELVNSLHGLTSSFEVLLTRRARSSVGIDEPFLRRYRELLDAEDAAFDELEHAVEENEREHYELDFAAWKETVARRLTFLEEARPADLEQRAANLAELDFLRDRDPIASSKAAATIFEAFMLADVSRRERTDDIEELASWFYTLDMTAIFKLERFLYRVVMSDGAMVDVSLPQPEGAEATEPNAGLM